MKIFVVFVFVFFCVLSTENGFAGEAKREELKIHGKSFLIYHHPIEVVKQSASPVLILAAHAIYIPRTTADVVRSIERDYWAPDYTGERDYWSNYNDEGVLISLDATGETAVVVQYGVRIFNSFNEYLGGFAPTSMEPPHHGMGWLYRHSDIFTFKGYGYAFVFIAKARLKDGSIWIYDVEEVRSQIGPEVKRLKLDEE